MNIDNITVIKRDGRRKEFAIERIYDAINKSYKEVYSELTEEQLDDVYDISRNVYIEIRNLNTTEIDVETIQDIVVKNIKNVDEVVAKAYQKYRDERSRERSKKSYVSKEMSAILNQTSEEITNNANKDGSKIQTLRAMFSDVACKNHARINCIPEDLQEKHCRSIYYHDENYFSMPFYNCCLIDWEDMFENGFHIGTTKIETPKSYSTAIDLLAQIISHVSSNCYGGVTLPRLVGGLVPYAKKSLEKYKRNAIPFVNEDKLNEYAEAMLTIELKNKAQSLEYEITTLTTARGEVPFVTIELDNGLFDTDENLKLSRMITESILNQRINGLTDGVTPVFPKIVYQVTKGINLNKEDINYYLFKLAIKCSAYRGYPDYINTDRCIEVTGDYKPPMGCRSFLSSFTDEWGNLKTCGRFNYCVTSISLPNLALQSKGNEDKFFELLDEALDDCKRLIMIRYNILKNVKAKQSPILYTEGAIARLNPEDSIEPLLNNNYSSVSIGYVGLHNALIALYGKSFMTDEDGHLKGEKIMQHIRNYCDTQKKITGIGFSQYGSPAEVLATKFCQNDVKEFGIVEGVNDNGYYENSFHYPSNVDVSPFTKLDLESKYSAISSGGAISFVELGDMTKNLEALEEVVRYSYDKTHFLGISTISDRCLECGFVGELGTQQGTYDKFICPKCGNTNPSKLSVIRKLCGYLGSLSERPSIWGKMKEINSRKDNTI